MKSHRGFTIVELIVVVVIIAALALLTVFAFGSWRARTAGTEVKNEATSISSAMTNYQNFNNKFPATIPDGYTATQNVTSTYVSGTDTTYCINVTSTAVTTVYASVSETGIKVNALCP